MKYQLYHETGKYTIGCLDNILRDTNDPDIDYPTNDQIRTFQRAASRRRNNRSYHYSPKNKAVKFDDNGMDNLKEGMGELFNQDASTEDSNQVSFSASSERTTKRIIAKIREVSARIRSMNKEIDSDDALIIIQRKENSSLGE